MKTVVMATSPRNFFQIIERQPVFVLLQAVLRELSFITLPAFLFSGNQTVRYSKRPRHLILPVVSRKGKNHKKSQFKTDQLFGRNRKTTTKGVLVKFWFTGSSHLQTRLCLVPQALFCRPFQRTVLRIRGKASSYVDFSPLNIRLFYKFLKGVETHRGIRQSRGLINPLIEINGKREPTA